MSSIRSKIIIGIVKNRHLLKGKRKPERADSHFSLTDFRSGIDKASKRMKLPKEIKNESFDINGMHAEFIIPPCFSKGKVLLYIHGGGFISGSCLTHRSHAAKFAKTAELKTLLFDYRLAPEHPFPAAPEDCLKAYRYLLANGYSGKDIVTGGESAGGTLVLSLLQLIKREKLEMPKAAFSISPVTDMHCQAKSFIRNASKDIALLDSWNLWLKEYYAGITDLSDPVLSPHFGDFTGFPPLHFCIGTHEVHHDDCLSSAEKAEQQGVDVQLRIWPEMVHAFPLLAPLFPEASLALKDIGRFVKNQIN